MTAYEFIISLKDKASDGLGRIAKMAGVSQNKISQTDRAMGHASQTTNKWSSNLRALGKTLLLAFSGVAIASFAHKVIDARAEYEKYQAVLANTFQSAEIGASALAMLQGFASETPFQLNELTGAFVKLVNRGINPTKGELTKMGDLAASQGKSFDQLGEAVLDATTGEFERLKEFGIKASKSGDRVSLSFKGVTQTVANNEQAIKDAIIAYGGMDGVAGAMEAISKTIGGRISNLQDKWNTFLVAIGGSGDSLIGGAIDLLSRGLSFLANHLHQVTSFFKQLWAAIEPVTTSLKNLILAIFPFEGAGNILNTFGNVISGVLVFVDLLSTGLTFLIDYVLTPLGPAIFGAAAAWALLNLAFAISPIGGVVIGIMALISVIGMVVKYTSGWGEAWNHVVNGAKLLWQGFVGSVKLYFNTLVDGLMIGINKIKEGWYSFKEALGMGDSSENQAMLDQIRADTERRKKEVQEGAKKVAETWAQAKSEFSQFKIDVDTEGISRDFSEIKKKFSSAGAGAEPKSDGAYQAYIDNLKRDSGIKPKGGEPTGDNPRGDKQTAGKAIISGGRKTTHITVNIGKLQDDTKIYVSNTKDGVNDLGAKVQELLLRAVNSVNQMAT